MNTLREDESSDVVPYDLVFQGYQKYADKVFEVFGIENAEDREDLKQELFLAFAKVANRVPQIKVRAWIRVAANSLVIDFVRRKNAQMRIPSDRVISLDIDIDAEWETAETIAIANEEVWSQIDTVAAELSDENWQIFLLRHETGLSTQQIADQLHLGEPAVRQRLVRTLKKLRKALAGVDIGIIKNLA